MKTRLIFFFPILLFCLTLTTNSFAEEKSLWKKFVNFFNPSPTLEGEGPLYDQLNELDAKISKTEGKYSREHRPGNKSRLKKELNDLKDEREALVQRILAEEKAKKENPAPVQSSSSEMEQSSAATCKSDTVFVHDTTIVKDTVIVHDTLYVIVADKPEKAKTDSTQESGSN